MSADAYEVDLGGVARPGHQRVVRGQRFSRDFRCPNCGGAAEDEEGRGIRCWGFVCDNGEQFYCMQGAADQGALLASPSEVLGEPAWRHTLAGLCPCGVVDHSLNPCPPPNGHQTGERPPQVEMGGRRLLYHLTFHDADGNPLFEEIRRETFPGERKFIRQRRWVNEPPDGYTYSLDGLTPEQRETPYALPTLLAADDKRWVFIVEGPRKAERLITAGLLATSNAMGAGNWTDNHSRWLGGRWCVILPDNDAPGYDHAEKVRDSLLRGGAAGVVIVDLPGLADGEDILEWLDADHAHTVEELEPLASAALAGGASHDPSRYERTNNELHEETPDGQQTGNDEDSSNSLFVRSYDDFPVANAAMFTGVAGELIQQIAPHTESDPVGLLFQLLTAFGNLAGRHVYFLAEADRHYPALFSVIVGSTSRSRKGTGRGHIMQRLRAVDEFWVGCNIESGLSSGEGIIHALRNTKEEDAARQDEPLLKDKRLLVVQSEFSVALKMLTREGNILSDVLRDAWDGVPLGTLTKHSRERASNYHLSIIGNITQDELVRNLTATESANGFGNRFLWVATHRAQRLPNGGNIESVDFRALDQRLVDAVEFASTHAGERATRDSEAQALWEQQYEELTSDQVGLLGALTARAEAQVVRLSLVYALLDCSLVIRAAHLRAALACWKYAEDSVRYLFGDALGEPVADTILTQLRHHRETGLSRTALHDLFGRNMAAAKLTAALERLRKAHLARCVEVKTGGKPAEVWHALFEGDTA